MEDSTGIYRNAKTLLGQHFWVEAIFAQQVTI